MVVRQTMNLEVQIAPSYSLGTRTMLRLDLIELR